MMRGANKPRRRKPELRKVLAMTLDRKPFDEIIAGKKKTEYRANKAYWRKRLTDQVSGNPFSQRLLSQITVHARRVSRPLEIRKGTGQLFWHPVRPRPGT
jgi:hypothetical protein